MTSQPQYMGSEPAHRLPHRALGPYRVAPIGYGAMRLTGPGVFGPPPDRDDAVQLLRQAVEAGVDHIDTAEYYGPHVVNKLIRQALHPYPTELVLVSKVGARRDDRGGIFAYDEPAQLRRGIEENLRTLDVDSVHVVNLRLMRASRPDSLFDDQLAAMTAARDNGLIGAVGLSNVTLPHLLRALKSTEIACVQNAYHPADRSSQPVLEECTRRHRVRAVLPAGFGRTTCRFRPQRERGTSRRRPTGLLTCTGCAGLGAARRAEHLAHPRHDVAGTSPREPRRCQGHPRCRRGSGAVTSLTDGRAHHPVSASRAYERGGAKH